MTSILFERRPKGPEPLACAFYSIVPGIGQLYNGKTKKGILFLCASFISLLILYGTVHPASTLQFALFCLVILKFTVGLIFKFEYEPSPAAEFLMNSIKFGGSFSTLLLITIVSFVLYSMVDAYMDAEKALQKFDQKIISTDSTMFRFSESTASSYIIHSIVFSSLFLISLFLVIPTKEREQITEIEFIMPQIESKKPPPPETKRRSSVQSIDQGKHIPKKEITPAQPSRPPSPPPVPRPKPVQQIALKPPAPVPLPKPKIIPKPVPRITEQEALVQAPPRPAPIAPQTEEEVPEKNVPQPTQETPDTALRGVQAQIVVSPRIPGVGGAGTLGAAGNPPPNPYPNAPNSLAAKKDINFGPYMEDLQRRIKRAWRPPRGNESKRVIVTFKLNRTGQLSDLILKVPSGLDVANKAALIAVQTAAPFPPLPHGAPDIVDIEFTFDYNVFGSSSSYKKF